MRRILSLGIRGRLLAAFLGVLIPYLALAGIGAVGLQVLWQEVRAIQDKVVKELDTTGDLQLALTQLAMPANDYLITGDPEERVEFDRRLARAREALARAETAFFDAQADSEERRVIEAVGGQLAQMEALSREILAVPDPLANRLARDKMRALDRLADEATAALGQIHDAAHREIEENMERGSGVVRRATAAGVLALVLSMAGGVVLALGFAAWVSRPILAIAETSRRMAGGDLSQRVAAHAGGELGEVARAFNEMAERLGASAVEKARLYEEAEAQRIRLTLVMESASDAIIIADSAGHIVSWNSGAQTLFGYTPDQILGKPAGTLMPERYREAHRAELQRLGSTGVAHVIGRAIEVTGLRRDGGEVPLELSLAGWTTKEGTFYSGIARDITERKQVERMKSDFVSFVTHQLRTPLAGIKWMLELATQGTEVPAETRSYLQDAREANERLIRLVNDLLNVSRLESGRMAMSPQEVDLHEVTVSVVDELGLLVREKGHRLALDADAALPRVVVDAQLLRQVVLNLVANAVKYTKPGGEIAIRLIREGATVRFLVRDSGIGVPKGSQGRLFEKFFRAENVLTMETEGTGLGLYLVRLIVEQFGGRISCESEEGRGSTFTFTLPLPD